MFTFLISLMIIIAILLGATVLVQNPKNEGMGNSISGSGNNQLMGVKKASDTLENVTWIFIILLMSLCLLSSFLLKKNKKLKYHSINIENAQNSLE